MVDITKTLQQKHGRCYQDLTPEIISNSVKDVTKQYMPKGDDWLYKSEEDGHCLYFFSGHLRLKERNDLQTKHLASKACNKKDSAGVIHEPDGDVKLDEELNNLKFMTYYLKSRTPCGLLS